MTRDRIHRGSKVQTVHDGMGNLWAAHDRGGHWNPFSRWPRDRPSYFCDLGRATLDASAFWDQFHTKPPGFPFPLWGRATCIIDRKGFGWHRDVVDLLGCCAHLDVLVLRLRLLRAECDVFHTLGRPEL